MFGINRTVRSLFSDRKGNVGIIFALMTIPVLGATGMAVDYSRAFTARTRMQHAADAGAMAGGLAANLTQSERISTATASFNANGGNLAGSTPVTTDVQFLAGALKFEASATINTTFLQLLSISSIPISVEATVSTAGKKLEMAVMLDTTGSMGWQVSGGSGTKLAALKSAMRIMLDTVMPAGATSTKMSIVPFAKYVKVPNDNPAAYTGRTGWATKQCALERKHVSRPDETPPVLGTNEFWIHTNNNSQYCGPIHEIVPLTNDRSVLDPLFDASTNVLQAYGPTTGHLGTQWAWHTISPLWAGRWPADSTPVSYTDDGTMKAVVLMTDGANTEFHKNENGSSASCDGQNHCQKADDEMKANCDAMKAKQNSQGGEAIMIFAVGFGLPAVGTTAGDKAREVLQYCASDDPNHPGQKLYFYPVTQEDIEAAFRNIGETVSNEANKPRIIN